MEAQEGEEGVDENAQEEDSLMDLISGQSPRGKVEAKTEGVATEKDVETVVVKVEGKKKDKK